MDKTSIHIRYGEFDDVVAHPERYDDVTIVPAIVRLTGNPMTNGSHLDEFLKAHDLSPETKALIHPGQDAPWVCGRVQRIFSLPQVPEEDRGEKSCMDFSFLAAFTDNQQLIGIPFVCTDYYGHSVLIFSGDAPPQAMIDRVAGAFWNIMLADPHDLPEYTDRFVHLGGGFDVRFGVHDGEPFMEEIIE